MLRDRPAGGDRYSARDLTVLLVLPLLLNVAAWTLYAELATSGAIHEDAAEAWAWGREFQLGYYKHPPFWAWIAGLWFMVMPQRNWAFSLLAVLNANVGLLGAWALIGRFTSGEKRAAATLLLLATPLYTFLCFKYNANTIFLSLWPWTGYAFLRSVEERGLWPAVLFGLLAAAALLSKYYAVLLLGSCALALLAHPGAKTYLRSASPYVSAGVAALLLAPHLWWLATTGFLPIRYLQSERVDSYGVILGKALIFLLECLIFHALVFGLLLAADPQALGFWRRRPGLLAEPRGRILAILALAPALLTAAAGLVVGIRVSPNMAVGVFCLSPLLLIEIAGIGDIRQLRRLAGATAVLVTLAALATAPFTGAYRFSWGHLATIQPRMELAAESTRVWREATGTPLAIVGGDPPWIDTVAFYSPDRPRVFTELDFRLAPWITPRAIADRGLLIICSDQNAHCLGRASQLAPAAHADAAAPRGQPQRPALQLRPGPAARERSGEWRQPRTWAGPILT